MFDLLLETFFFYGTVIVEHDFMGYSNIVVPIKNQKSNVYTKIYYRIQLRLKSVFFKEFFLCIIMSRIKTRQPDSDLIVVSFTVISMSCHSPVVSDNLDRK